MLKNFFTSIKQSAERDIDSFIENASFVRVLLLFIDLKLICRSHRIAVIVLTTVIITITLIVENVNALKG